MKRLQIPQKLVYIFTYTKKIYIHEIAAVNLLPEKRKKKQHVNQTTAFKSRWKKYNDSSGGI